jgi:hypothetical protein
MNDLILHVKLVSSSHHAPRQVDVSITTHGHLIKEISFRDYFLNREDKYSWGTLAHSTHVRGIGTYENGVVKRRVQARRGPGIPREKCEQINLEYRDPDSINSEDYAGREDDGILLVPKAGEMFIQLCEPPLWERAEL